MIEEGYGELTDLGNGYAKTKHGVAFYHGQKMADAPDLARLEDAGNGYATKGSELYYKGEKVEGFSLVEGKFEQLGGGWSRTADNTYVHRGRAVKSYEAREECPYFAERGEPATKAAGGTADDPMKPDAQRWGTYHVGVDKKLRYEYAPHTARCCTPLVLGVPLRRARPAAAPPLCRQGQGSRPHGQLRGVGRRVRGVECGRRDVVQRREAPDRHVQHCKADEPR